MVSSLAAVEAEGAGRGRGECDWERREDPPHPFLCQLLALYLDCNDVYAIQKKNQTQGTCFQEVVLTIKAALLPRNKAP